MKNGSFRDRRNSTYVAIAITLATLFAATGMVRAGLPGEVTDSEYTAAWQIVDQFVEIHDPIWETGEFPVLGPELQDIADNSQTFRNQLHAEMSETRNQRHEALAEGFRIGFSNTYLEDATLSRASSGGVKIKMSVTRDALFVDIRTSEQENRNETTEYLIVLPPEATGSRSSWATGQSENEDVQIQRLSKR